MNIRGVTTVLVAFGLAFAASAPVLAAEYGGGSVQGYTAETSLTYGTIVQLADKAANKVAVAKGGKAKDTTQLYGVVVDPSSQPLTIRNDDAPNEAFVAVSGTYNVLVSTQAGAIHTGDYITLSAIDGVGMNAGISKTHVLGRANANFDGKGIVVGSTTLKDEAGGSKQVSLGMVPVTIDIRTNPNDKSTKANLPEMLQRVGQTIAEKEVSPIRIYISVGVSVVSLIAAIVMLYAGIRNSVISIGRNPMSKKSIFRALIEVVLTSLLILVIGLFAVYLLLRL